MTTPLGRIGQFDSDHSRSQDRPVCLSLTWSDRFCSIIPDFRFTDSNSYLVSANWILSLAILLRGIAFICWKICFSVYFLLANFFKTWVISHDRFLDNTSKTLARLETKCVGDNYMMLVTVLAILITIATFKRCHQHRNSVTDFKPSTSLPTTWHIWMSFPGFANKG